MRYAYYPGCSSDASAKGLGLSARSTAAALDMELVELEDWTCCGSTPYGSLDEEESVLVAARNLALAEKAGLDIVTPCSSCYVVLCKANEHLRHNGQLRGRVNEALGEVGLSFKGNIRVRQLVEVLYHDVGPEAVKAKVRANLNGLKVASYYGCQMVRPYGFEDPENPRSLDEIAESLGAVPVDFPRKNRCCGGSLIIPETGLALGLIRELLESARDGGADCIITPCPLCQMNLDAYQSEVNRRFKTGFNIPVLFVTQLIGLALGIERSKLGLNTNIIPLQPVYERLDGVKLEAAGGT